MIDTSVKYWFRSWKKGGSALNIYVLSFTHIIGFLMKLWWQLTSDTIANNYEVIYVIKTVIKYY